MTRALVMSDSHGSAAQLERMVQAMWRRYPDGFQAYIHCGDGARDFECLRGLIAAKDPRAMLVLVRGNNDWGSDLNDDTVVTLGGMRVFVCHGHRYRVKTGLLSLEYAAAERRCPIALYGHTHVADAEAAGGVSMFNPGAVMNGRIGVLEIDGGVAGFQFFALQEGDIHL